MPHDFQSILDSKQSYRRQLAGRPIGEKLRLLDLLRERELAIRGRGSNSRAAIVGPKVAVGGVEATRVGIVTQPET